MGAVGCVGARVWGGVCARRACACVLARTCACHNMMTCARHDQCVQGGGNSGLATCLIWSHPVRMPTASPIPPRRRPPAPLQPVHPLLLARIAALFRCTERGLAFGAAQARCEEDHSRCARTFVEAAQVC